MVFRNSDTAEMQDLYNECKRMMNYHTVLRMRDGSVHDGIIESVEPSRVNVLVGEDVMDEDEENEDNMQRQPYNNPRRARRYGRRSFPLVDLLALSLLPYPYYAPPYPYSPYYPNAPFYPY